MPPLIIADIMNLNNINSVLQQSLLKAKCTTKGSFARRTEHYQSNNTLNQNQKNHSEKVRSILKPLFL